MQKQLPSEFLLSTSGATDFAIQALEVVGMNRQDATAMAEYLIDADLSGHPSHGIRQLAGYVDRIRSGMADVTSNVRVLTDSGGLVTIDAERSFGVLVLRDVVDLGIARSRVHGIAAISIRHSEHAGRLAPYCERAAREGVATLLFGNDGGGCQQVAPYGGDEARLSTNPIAFGVPRSKAPHLVVDMATSVVSGGTVELARERGDRRLEEWVTRQGALRSFGSHKGFGLALIAEALAGALSGAGIVRPGRESTTQGLLLIAIDVNQMRELSKFALDVDEFLAHVKTSAPEVTPGTIKIPGERALPADAIRLTETTALRLRQLAEDLRLEEPLMVNESST